MLRLRDLGANTPMGVPYTEEQIMAMDRKGKQRGHIHRVGRVVAGKGRNAIFIDKPRGTYTDVDVDELKEEAKRTRRELQLLRTVVKSDDRMSEMLIQLESQHEIGGSSGSGSGGGGDDELGEDEDVGGDEKKTFYIWILQVLWLGSPFCRRFLWVVSLLVFVVVDGQSTHPTEVTALQVIKDGFIDPDNTLSNWRRGDPCQSNWTGVLCFNRTLNDSYLHVREL
ncbi:probable LRR receptor-like serine/threonine-protein kinase isoform X1, partial [Tanacetum coccineum]